MRSGFDGPPILIDIRVKSVDPARIRIIVLKPAGFDLYSRSNPINAPKKREMMILSTSSNDISIDQIVG